MNGILGYKAFNQDFTNRYGHKFQVGKIYRAKGLISWGKYGNGFHLCTNLEDCFRYFDPKTSLLAQVRGFGRCIKNDDEYYGYYDMYVCEYLKVLRVIPREEIINMMLQVDGNRQQRFIDNYNLTEKEKDLFGGMHNERDCNQRGKRKQLKKYRY